MHPLVISFYTLDTPYEQEVIHLLSSCRRFEMETCVEGKSSEGSWERNCALKPFYILQKLEELKRPLLWVDADAVFLKKPHFDEFLDYDFSVRFNEGLPESDSSKVLSGTIFVNHTSEGIDILKLWCEECQKQLAILERLLEVFGPDSHLSCWDQIALKEVLMQKKSAKVFPMPVSYCKIFDLDATLIAKEEVVIEHYQASRRFKKDIC